MFKKNNHNFSFIKNTKELNEFIQKIKNKKIFFLDTEFDRKSTYKAIISFITVYDGKNIGVIDCLEKKFYFIKIFYFFLLIYAIKKVKFNLYKMQYTI